MKTGGELKIIEQAVKQKWNIPPAAFTEIPKTLYKIAKDGSNRDQVAAARLLKSMNDANADVESPAPKAPQVHLHADITGSLNGDAGNTGSGQPTVLDRLRALLDERRRAAGIGVTVVEPTAVPTAEPARRQTDTPPKSSARKQPKAKSTRKRNRRDTTGK